MIFFGKIFDVVIRGAASEQTVASSVVSNIL
jgi:hypothetical protein